MIDARCVCCLIGPREANRLNEYLNIYRDDRGSGGDGIGVEAGAEK